MTNVVRFPGGGRPVPAAVIPRAEFERLACLALDVADRIMALLDDADGHDHGEAKSLLSLPRGENEPQRVRPTSDIPEPRR